MYVYTHAHLILGDTIFNRNTNKLRIFVIVLGILYGWNYIWFLVVAE